MAKTITYGSVLFILLFFYEKRLDLTSSMANNSWGSNKAAHTCILYITTTFHLQLPFFIAEHELCELLLYFYETKNILTIL